MATTIIEPRSERGKRRYAEKVVEPIDQIRVPMGGITGAWCYWIRTDGATIADALILTPNGAGEGKFGANSAYFREKGQRKGRIYLGQSLTVEGVKRLVEVIAANRQDEILFTEDEIAEQDAILQNAESQRDREIAHKRKRQYNLRLQYLQQPFDPETLVAELNEIARAQRLAKLDPNILAVMKEMVGEVNDKMAAMVTRFAAGKSEIRESDPDLGTGPSIKHGPGRPRKVNADQVNADFMDVD